MTRKRESKGKRSYYCYLVECADGTFYTGWTVDVTARVRAHNAGRGARYTRARRPVNLVYWETLRSRSEAMKRERQMKQYSRARKLQLAAKAKGATMKGEHRNF